MHSGRGKWDERLRLRGTLQVRPPWCARPSLSDRPGAHAPPSPQSLHAIRISALHTRTQSVHSIQPSPSWVHAMTSSDVGQSSARQNAASGLNFEVWGLGVGSLEVWGMGYGVWGVRGSGSWCRAFPEAVHSPPLLTHPAPLPSEEPATRKVSRTSTWKSRPEPGLDYLICAEVGRQRLRRTPPCCCCCGCLRDGRRGGGVDC